MNQRSRGVILACSLCLFGACETTEESTTNADLGVSAVQFQDVVVPDGMLIRDTYSESYSREEQGWRYGHFVYVGEITIDEACTHVLHRMPQHAWKLIADERPEEAARKLKFERGRSTAEYSIERSDGQTHMVIDYRTRIPTP